DYVEAVERRVWRPDDAVELYITLVRIERDQQHVVHGRQRPEQQHDGERHRGRGGEHPPPRARPAQRLQALHTCTARVWSGRVRSVRIRRIASGISTGRADITTATPRAG